MAQYTLASRLSGRGRTQYVAQELELYATKCGARLRPTTPLQNLAKTNRKFYGNGPKTGAEASVATAAVERGV